MNLAEITFQLESTFLSEFRGRQPEWGPLGYITFKRTYSRARPEGGTEEWWEVCKRVVEGEFSIQKNHCLAHRLPWKEEKAQRTAQKTFRAMWDFRFLPPGRGLWAMGTPHIRKVGGLALNNCAFVATDELVDNPSSRPFAFLMDCSMLGVGVGFNTNGAGALVYKPESSSIVMEIEDSREGWVKSTAQIIEAYLLGAPLYRYNYEGIRPAGALIKGFGGVSSGPGPLIELHKSITDLFDSKLTDLTARLTSSDIVDIMNMIGKCVVAGNVRRSAEVALGSSDDKAFLTLKQDKEKLLSHRWASNNSIYANVGMDYAMQAVLSGTNGEPGYFWLDNARQYGRLKDGINNLDSRVMGANPCLEQVLESYEVCCLVETFIGRHATLAEYLDTLKLAYLYAKTVTLVPTHWPETNSVMLRNRRIGCSQSGITRAFSRHSKRTILKWCDEAYTYVKGLDSQYSQWLCIPTSIKRTSIKPSGTVSLLPGEPPGIHYPPSEYYIRRIRFASNSSWIRALRMAGYPIEPDVASPDTLIVSFPVKERCFTRGESEVTMWEQLENVAQYQYYWADNAVSATIKFNPEKEGPNIKDALELYETRLKAISFLPYIGHGYAQAPYQPISREDYELLSSTIKPELLFSTIIAEEGDGGKSAFCDSDACTLGK